MKIRKLKTAEEIKKFLDANKTQYVKVAITDIDGVLRGKYMHVDKFIKSSKSGFGFCDVIFGWDSNDELYDLQIPESELFTGWHSGFPDTKASIIADSGRLIPFEEDIPFFLAELSEDPVCPRGVLNNILEKYKKDGMQSKAAFEYEFFLFDETSHSLREKKYQNLKNFTPGMFGYSILRSSTHSDLYNQLLNLCLDMDMHLEGLHTETGPGVIEAAIMVDESLNAADKATLFKTFSKVLFQKNNLIANFMAKWSQKYPGQSGHIHVSLQDAKGNPLFGTSKSEELPKDFTYFIGGLQKYMREFSVMIAPTVNSYNRLCPGAWAPINMTWGIENRTTAFRVITGDAKSQRIENRLPGADSNPYLALAATLGAGYLGMKEKIEPTAPTIGGAYDLKVEKSYQVPSNLGEAARLFKQSESAKELFGEEFVDHFANSRSWEFEEFLKNKSFFDSSDISQWELERYFEII